MPGKPEKMSAAGIVLGALSGALLGALVSAILMAGRPDGSKGRKTPGVLDYLQLIIALFILAKQAGDLVVGQRSKA